MVLQRAAGPKRLGGQQSAAEWFVLAVSSIFLCRPTRLQGRSTGLLDLRHGCKLDCSPHLLEPCLDLEQAPSFLQQRSQSRKEDGLRSRLSLFQDEFLHGSQGRVVAVGTFSLLFML